MSRVMFSIHSLAAKLGSDSAWLLTHAQLTRVEWRMGAHEGEIIIERDASCDNDDDTVNLEGAGSSSKRPRYPLIRTTCVGVHDQPWYGRPLVRCQ